MKMINQLYLVLISIIFVVISIAIAGVAIFIGRQYKMALEVAQTEKWMRELKDIEFKKYQLVNTYLLQLISNLLLYESDEDAYYNIAMTRSIITAIKLSEHPNDTISKIKEQLEYPNLDRLVDLIKRYYANGGFDHLPANTKCDAKYFIQTYQNFVDDYNTIYRELEQYTNQIRSTKILSLVNPATAYTERTILEADHVMVMVSDRLKRIMNEESGS